MHGPVCEATQQEADGKDAACRAPEKVEVAPPAGRPHASSQFKGGHRKVHVEPLADKAPLWEVETDLGWNPFTPGVFFKGCAGEEIRYTHGEHQYRAVFTTDIAGTQTNLASGATRKLRRPRSGSIKGADHVKIQDSQGHTENKIARKGTGFVHVGELPPSDDEDEEEEAHHVKIQDSQGHTENKIARKGTGFVHAGELPDSDDEFEDEEHYA